MKKFLFLVLIIASVECNHSTAISPNEDWEETFMRGALISTRFNSLEELKKVVKIEYFTNGKPAVHLTHQNNGKTVVCVSKSGISELDIKKARDGGFWSKVKICLKSPYLLYHRNDLLRVFILAKRRGNIFGENDIAFFNIADDMLNNITEEDFAMISPRDLSEKGYLNTFNHITAQAFITTLFSEKLADFVANTHERTRPELQTGKFTKEQLLDLDNGPVDNYVDMINNEWGQELGKVLKKKHNITRKTQWTPEVTASYLNDIQSYYSWGFQMSFTPFKSSEEIVIKFSNKINRVMESVSGLK